MIASCPTTEAVEYLRAELAKYERKCRDIEIGTSIPMGKDPTVVERIMVVLEEQAKEYQTLSNKMGKILQGLTRIKKDTPLHQPNKRTRSPRLKKNSAQTLAQRTAHQ